ncbi:MAG TPA: PD-(D/E)XK nuclease family protein, partial [Thermoanaerobaculia bacterium]|nr:PD-(D/E)XK nuclease family protein [Thermoanaerobaculia bacterium]
SARLATPLTAHRIGRGMATLLRLRDRDFPRGEVLEVVRSGLKLQTRINADKADAETRQALIAGGPSTALEHRAGRSVVLADYVALVGELEALTERIDAAFLLRTIDLFRIDDAGDLAAVQAIEEIAQMFVRAGRWKRPLEVHAVLDAVEQAAIEPRAPAAAEPVVWMGDVMRLRGRTFDHLYAVRMQDDVLPQRRTEDPLLPDSDRRLLGVREIGDGRDEEALLFDLMRGAVATHFSYAASDGFGKPLRPSQTLKAFAITQVPEEKSGILKRFSAFARTRAAMPPPPAERRAGSPALQRALQLFVRAGAGGVFDGYVDTPLLRQRTTAALQSISPTQLEDFGECPQKFLLKHILGVRAVDDPDREVQINHREKGVLDHAVLERFYRATDPGEIRGSAGELPRLPANLAERLEQIIDEEFDAIEQRLPPSNRSMREMERRATKRLLREFVAADLADLIERDLLPAHFEYRFGSKHRRHEPDHPEPFIIETDGVPIRVEGTIDRIDSGRGRFRIVDYKSGKAGRHEDLASKIDRGVRLQLPLYAMAAAAFFGAPAGSVSAAIKPLVRGETAPEKFAFELAAAEQRLRETLEIFVRAITSGAFPAFPNESDKDFHSCKYCPVRHSCRTRHDPGEQRAALQWGDPRSMLLGDS